MQNKEEDKRIPVKMADHSFDEERYALTTTILRLEEKLRVAKEALQLIKADDDPSNSGYSNGIANEALSSL